MKKLVIIMITLLFMAGYTASAQNGTQPHPYSNNQEKKQSMMMQKNGKMQDMMNKGICPMSGQTIDQNMPMKKYGMMVNQLPNMQQQLALNDKQVEQLDNLQARFIKQQIDFQSELQKKQMKLKDLLNDMAPASQVKDQMKDCVYTKINMKIAAYETAGEMKAVLTNSQKEQMKNMMMPCGEMMQK